ncbi:HEPN domain-containing protein [Algoriphagus halophytocola]|uniref:HEPN domain-containing protein n=1 Tax=Algoriphagus halophytocola TaxID=2991499 RepID=UPI0022DD66E2|nr:HEPN domain-containing protein [Algoriphagus sp. TR-M9]WBL41925.1 HEPN domain-containing protein [Algoriphagus sp. TR-M9]
MFQLNFKHSPEEIFDSYYEEDINAYLWEMHQSWLLEIAKKDLTDLEISSRLFFFELLITQVNKQMELFHARFNRSMNEKNQELCKALELLIQPKAIYWKKGNDFADFYLLLPNLSPDQHDEVEKTMGFLCSSSSEFHIHSIAYSYLSKQLEEGTPYFWKEFSQTQPVYQSADFKGLPELSKRTWTEIQKKALIRYDSGMKKAEELMKQAQSCKTEMKVFLLHQAAELSLRTILQAWEMQEKKTHEIRVLLRYAGKYIPELTELFQSEEELTFLSLLDKSYSQSRYKPQFNCCTSATEKINAMVGQILNLCLLEREKLSNELLAN